MTQRRRKKEKVTQKVPAVPQGSNSQGRPYKYKPEYATVARAMSYVGSTMEQIAEFLGVNRRTLYSWKETHSDFADALEARTYGTAEVVLALHQRAVGYSTVETVEELEPMAGGMAVSKEKRTIKHVPPDIKAIELWLKNRAPDDWSQRDDTGDEDDHVERLLEGRKRAMELEKRLKERQNAEA